MMLLVISQAHVMDSLHIIIGNVWKIKQVTIYGELLPAQYLVNDAVGNFVIVGRLL